MSSEKQFFGGKYLKAHVHETPEERPKSLTEIVQNQREIHLDMKGDSTQTKTDCQT